MVTVVVENYQPKGEYIQFNDMKTYVVGDPNSTIAIIYVYDAFGQTPRTLQGADILAKYAGAVVIMPDFFRGEAATLDLFPPDTEEKKAKVQAFLCGAADIPNAMPKILAAARDIREKYPSVKYLGGIGFCWGGKLIALTSNEDTPFDGTIQCHPGRLEKEDAEKIVIPHVVLASDGEPEEAIEGYKKVFKENKEGRVKEKSHIEHYKGCFHGWMGGKAKLEDEFFKGEYARGYDQSSKWFKDVLQKDLKDHKEM